MPREALTNAKLPAPKGYSRAVRAHGSAHVYTSMTAPIDRDGNVVGVGDAAAQTRAAIDNISDILEQNGSGLADVVKVTAYVCEGGDLAGVMAAIGAAFADPPPAIALAVVGRLPNPDFLVEVDATATVA